MSETVKFKALRFGDSFDWVNDAHPCCNSFYNRCVKVSARGYHDGERLYQVGSINATVYHVMPRPFGLNPLGDIEKQVRAILG